MEEQGGCLPRYDRRSAEAPGPMSGAGVGVEGPTQARHSTVPDQQSQAIRAGHGAGTRGPEPARLAVVDRR